MFSNKQMKSLQLLYADLSGGKLLWVNAFGEPFFDDDGHAVKISLQRRGKASRCAQPPNSIRRILMDTGLASLCVTSGRQSVERRYSLLSSWCLPFLLFLGESFPPQT